MDFALSTSWNASQSENTKELLFEINQLGFKQIELSFNFSPAMVKDVARLAGSFGLSVISLHNYCPVPDEFSRDKALPDCYSMSSLDEFQRLQAVKYTKRTIDMASVLGAKAVVLHCGRVEVVDRTRQLIGLYDQGRKDSAEFTDIKSRMRAERDDLAQGFLNRTLKSLDQLNKHAKEQNILLGVETRFYHREIPSFDELKVILDKFEYSQIFYWHDTGHAQLMENLGFTRHKDFLDLGSDRLIGVHLHDISSCRDHLAPGQGALDFSILNDYLKTDTIKVIEAHAPAIGLDIIKGRQYLTEVFNKPNANP
ncbi:MAG: sugar phosphate isomerase/epimerase family protein [Candidatus Omnitrophota bacterium]